MQRPQRTAKRFAAAGCFPGEKAMSELARKCFAACASLVLLSVLISSGAIAQSGTWTTKAPMPTARTQLAAGVVNGIVYAIGGFTSSQISTNEAYDPIANTWAAKAPMPSARNLAATNGAVVGGKVYVI